MADFATRAGSVCLDVINQTWSPMFGTLSRPRPAPHAGSKDFLVTTSRGLVSLVPHLTGTCPCPFTPSPAKISSISSRCSSRSSSSTRTPATPSTGKLQQCSYASRRRTQQKSEARVPLRLAARDGALLITHNNYAERLVRTHSSRKAASARSSPRLCSPLGDP